MFTLDKYLGSMFGLAVGDAFGAPVEFNLPGSFKTITDLIGGGYFKLKPGEWTDDTSLALCSAISLLKRKGFDPQDTLKKFLRWYREGYMSSKKEAFGIGLVTAAALMRFETTGESYCGPTGPKTALNGSVMHIAPIALAYANNPPKASEIAAKASRLTHGAVGSIESCKYLTSLIISFLGGEVVNKNGLIKSEFRKKPKINNKNYSNATTTLHAALWAFHSTDTFEDGLIKVVNLGWDADTMGAVYGQLAGAYYGYKAIPKKWIEKIAKRKFIEKIANRLFNLAQEIK